MRVGLYARVSTERQQERGTISSQLEALRAAAEADGHEVVEEFVDDGYSGARLDRPALDRLRDAAEAGVLDGVLCLCADRLARAYAYQVLILEELERFGVSVRFLEGPAHGDDPQVTPPADNEAVIAEYEKAKIAERYLGAASCIAPARARFCSGGSLMGIGAWSAATAGRRGSRSSNPRRRSCARSSTGMSSEDCRFARSLFGCVTADPFPDRQADWGTSTIDRRQPNQAYIGTMYYNRYESLEGGGPRGARNRKTRQRERPREEWIAIAVPAIIDRDTFERVKHVTRDFSQWSPRGAEPGAWLLRGRRPVRSLSRHLSLPTHARPQGHLSPLLSLSQPRRATRRLQRPPLSGAQHPRQRA